MIKHYCDECGFEIPTGTMVRISMKVRSGGRGLDENFSSCNTDIVKDYCVDCGKKIIGEDTIKEIVKNRLERLAKAEERRKERIKSAADEECEE